MLVHFLVAVKKFYFCVNFLGDYKCDLFDFQILLQVLRSLQILLHYEGVQGTGGGLHQESSLS